MNTNALSLAIEAARIAAVANDAPRYVYLDGGSYTVAMNAPRSTHFHKVRPDGSVSCYDWRPEAAVAPSRSFRLYRANA